MNQKHLMIIDPLEKLNPALDSSLRMAVELIQLGHEVYMTEAESISWDSRSQGSPGCLAALMTFDAELKPASASQGIPQHLNLSDFHGIHMRKEPPFDMSYIAVTWFLDAVADRCRIFNAPSALRAFNEKVGILQFPGYCDPALVTGNLREARNFIREACKGDAIIKPLDMYGGKGIFRIEEAAGKQEAEWARLAQVLNEGPKMIQPFNHSISEGEVRVFTLAGRPLNWVLKKPAEGSFFANTSAGATLHPYEPSESLKEKISTVARQLYSQGVAVTGFDVIGEKISEINITSPRLLQPAEDERNYYKEMAVWFARSCEDCL